MGPCRLGRGGTPRTGCNSGTLSSAGAFQTGLRGTAVDGRGFLRSVVVLAEQMLSPARGVLASEKQSWQFSAKHVATTHVPNIPPYSGSSTNPKEAMHRIRLCIFVTQNLLVLPVWFWRWSVVFSLYM